MSRTRTILLALMVLARSLSAQFAVGQLTRLGDYESRRTSSYDRTGANGDYRHLKSGETMELFSEDGPTEIRHIWITMATGEVYHLKKVVLRMYWDGESEPSVEAPIRFRQSIKVTIEDGHANLRSDNLYSVAYWYQKEPHAKFPGLPPAEERIPKFMSTGGPGQDRKMK